MCSAYHGRIECTAGGGGPGTRLRAQTFESIMPILLADIGGSKSRFALAESSGGHTPPVVVDNDKVAGFEGAIAHFLDATEARPERATLAVAGPVDGEEIMLTNRPWRCRRSQLMERFGFSNMRVLNDFEALAWALPKLSGADLRPLGNATAAAEGVQLVIGPGTGLGIAALVPANGHWHVLASEGGHGLFGPQSPDEFEIFARIAAEYGSVCAETILSGRGLMRLEHALAPAVAHDAPETLVERALVGEPSALATARLFLRLLGRFAGSMALTFKALGGVYVAGGIARALEPLFDEPDFRASFEAHPPYEALLAAIPTWLITCPEPGLIGCAVVASSPQA
jgi:glucokinase